MQRFEYKVVPAPKKGQRGKGVKGADARFAHALEQLMNEHAATGWEYQRTDTLPAEERSGIASKTTVYQNMLIFRRPVEVAQPSAQAPAVATPSVGPAVAPIAATAAVPIADLIPDEELDEILSELEAASDNGEETPPKKEQTTH